MELFRELDIQQKANVYVVLPNVHLDFESLPLIVGDDGVNNAILSKAEDNYIFKRVEPVSAWADLTTNTSTDKRLIVYTSFQQTAISQIRDVFAELGVTLVGIESSYSAILRGVYFTGIVDEEEQNDGNWNLLLINSNSYALFSLSGSRLVDYTEVPLAIKSFSYEEAYQAIATSVSQVLPNFPARKLIVVSQAEDICAEVLKTQIVYDEKIIAYDCNKYSKEPPMETAPSVLKHEAAQITFAMLGALSVGHVSENFLNLNILGGEVSVSDVYFVRNVMGKEIPVTKEVVQKVLGAIAAVIVLIGLIIMGIIAGLEKCFSEGANDFVNKANLVQQEKNAITSEEGVVDIESLVTDIIALNKKSVNFYDSIAADIPPNLWLLYYYNRNGYSEKNPTEVAIEGVSSNIADIYTYYKSLKVISPESSIKLNRLQIMTEVDEVGNVDFGAPDLGDKFYDFEISNTKSPKSKNQRKNQNKQQNTTDGQNQDYQNNESYENVQTFGDLEPLDIN